MDNQHTGTGRHLIYKTGGQSFQCRNGIAPNVDIKADGGYIMVAPSVHPHGTGIYQFLVGHSFDDMEPAELPAAWVEFLKSKDRPKSKPAANHDLPPASEAIIERCRQEVARCEPAIEGRGGDKRTFRVACIIFHEWGLSESEGRPILNEYNARCKPLWEEKALQHKIDSALNSTGQKPRGWKRSISPIEGEYYPPYGAVVLNPNRTQPSALAFRWEKYSRVEGFTLWYYADDFYRWTGNHYDIIPLSVFKGEILDWLTKSVMLKDNVPRQFPANSRTVNDVIEALKSVCWVPDDIMSGAWLGDGEVPPSSSLVFAQNCVYNWRADEAYEHDPRWFNLSAVDANIGGDVAEPERWLGFVDDLFGDDQASKDLLHEYGGLCLIPDTSYQKALLLVGPPRSGKGTIIRAFTSVVGVSSVANPTADQLTSEFGLQPLLGKLLAIISDARFSGREIQKLIERLLTITGEDSITINRKYRDHVTCKLTARFIIATNTPPILPDSSGAIANRLLALQLKRSFLGREDRTLDADLQQEKDGILRLMIEGLQRLEREGFTLTEYQASFVEHLEGLGSSIRDFVRQCCIVEPGAEVTTDSLYFAWVRWREDDKVEKESRGDRAKFGRDLRLAFPEVKRVPKRIHGSRYVYTGIKLMPGVSMWEEPVAG